MTSFERRADFAEIARRNVEAFFGAVPASWHLVVGDFAAAGDPVAERSGPAPGSCRKRTAPGRRRTRTAPGIRWERTTLTA